MIKKDGRSVMPIFSGVPHYGQPFVHSAQGPSCPDQLQPVDLGQLLGAARQHPTAPSLSCQHQGCPVTGARGMPSHLVPTPGQVLVQHVSWLQQAPNWVPSQPAVATVKRLNPVARPLPNQPEWAGMEAKVVLANWRPFVNVAVPGAGPRAGV